jgi:hypothetical protein
VNQVTYIYYSFIYVKVDAFSNISLPKYFKHLRVLKNESVAQLFFSFRTVTIALCTFNAHLNKGITFNAFHVLSHPALAIIL